MFGDDDEDYSDLSKEPEELEPSIGPDPPEVDVPEVEDTAKGMPTPGEDIDPDLYSLFWRLVIVLDVALFALAIGPLFIYFEGNWDVGGPLVALGLVSFAYAVSQYRSYRARSDPEEPNNGDSEGPVAGDSEEPVAGDDA